MEENGKKNNRYEPSELSRKDVKFISFADFKYFSKSRKLVSKNSVVKLTPIPAQLLNYLIINQGKSVSKKELIDYVWPDHVDVDDGVHKAINNFAQAIRKLRTDLGDKEKPWRFIDNPAQNIFSLKPKAKIHKKFSFKTTNSLIRNFLLIALTGTAVTAAALRTSNSIYVAFEQNALTEVKGQTKRATVSSEKSTLVFMHKPVNSTSWNLRARNLLTGESRVIVSGQNQNMYHAEPAFSPSGNQLAWIKTNYKDTCKLMTANFDAPLLKLNGVKELTDCSIPWFARTPQWKNESELLFSISQGLNKPNGIKLINTLTLEEKIITAPTESEQGDFGLSVSPDLNLMAYLRQSTHAGTGSELRIYDFSRNKDTLLKITKNPIYAVAWADNENILSNGSSGFELINLEGKVTSVSFGSGEQLSFPFRVADYEIGFVKGALRDDDIVIIDLESKEKDYSLSTTAHDYRVVLAKESEKLAHLSLKDGKRKLILKDKFSSKIIHSYHKNAAILDLAISPNGDKIAVVEDSQLTVFDEFGQIIYRKNMTVLGLSFTYDNQIVCGQKESKQVFIKSINLINGEVKILTTGFLPKALPNGDIYYFNIHNKTSEPTLYKISNDREVSKHIEAPFPVMTLNSSGYDIINNALYYVTSKDNSLELVKRQLHTDETETISPITNRNFSIDSKLKVAVTTDKGKVQNNLSRFILVK